MFDFMKKCISPCLVLSMLLAGCGNTPASESNEPTKSNTVIKWFDCLNGDEMVWDGVKEYNLDEFSGVTFRWHSEKLEAVTDKEIVTLYDGMPIWSVYFYDLTGDGNPELCSTISIGSGIIDNRIIIYDYAGGTSYVLSDRGNFDYILNMQDDALIVEKRIYMQNELIESGELVFLNDTIQLKSESNQAAAPNAVAPRIVLGEKSYYATELEIVKELPDGYEYAGELSEEELKDAYINGNKYYINKSKEALYDFYVYQECGTPIDDKTVDGTKRQWAYVKWSMEK